MVGTPKLGHAAAALLGSKTAKKKNKIVVGLKSHNCSREMLLRLLTVVASSGDTVLAVHVQDSVNTFDPNSFHIHEDLCKSKQVEFQVKVYTGSSFIHVLIQEVTLHFASMLVLGCSSSRPKEPLVHSCVHKLPMTCNLLVMDNAGQILLEQKGDSRSSSTSTTPKLHRAISALSICNSNANRPNPNQQSPKAVSILSASRSFSVNAGTGLHKIITTMQFFNTKIQKQVQQPASLITKEARRQFSPRELVRATEKFSHRMVIGENSHSTVYRGVLKDGQAVAVKVLKNTKSSGEELLQEVDILSRLNHDHIVQLLGYCHSRDMHAVVYNLLKGSLNEHLKFLNWKERMRVAVGVAKGLEYLHHSCSPPIIHRDVKSDNILLSHECHPQLSDFGTAMMNDQPRNFLATKEQLHVVGTLGYLAPEYVMYGKVNDKIDVYSYGVVLLELITGKIATQKNTEFKHGGLVLWARSLLSKGLAEQLIDPNLNGDYNREEMRRMAVAARFCLSHVSSRRPAITKVLKLLEEAEYFVTLQREIDGHVNGIGSEEEPTLKRCYD